MKTLLISDIHIDINRNYPVVDTLCQFAKDNYIEGMIIAGDISENVNLTINTIKKIKKELEIQVYYVPGNHDMWKLEDLSTDEIYAMYCKDENCLCGKEVMMGEHILIGDIGWYDYSFGNPKYSKEDFDCMEMDGRIWQDRIRNEWTKDNQAKCAWFTRRLEEKLLKHKNDKVILVTHMISHRNFCVPETKNNWSYFNAFLGTDDYRKLCEKYHVQKCLCGHVHYRYSFQENDTYYMCCCLNYEKEWQSEKDCYIQIENASQIIEL